MRALTCILAAFFLAVAPARGQETFPTLKIGDQIYTNARVSKATPVELTLLYDGGGRTIKLQDLPQELKAKYPYDRAEVAAFLKKQEQERQLLALEQQKRRAEDAAAMRVTLQTKEEKLREKLEPLLLEIKRLQKDINTQSRIAQGRPKNSPARLTLDNMRARMIRLRDEEEVLSDQLKSIQKEREKYK